MRRVDEGRIAYFNPVEIEAPQIEDIPFSAQVIARGFVSGRTVDRGTLGGNRHASGAVYDGEGRLLPEFVERDERSRDRFTPNSNPLTIDAVRRANAVRLAGRHVYLGELKGHFGHFLLESLARAWYLIENPSAQVIFHHRVRPRLRQRSFWAPTFESLALEFSRITFANEDLIVDQLIMPSCQYWNRWKASPGFVRVFDHMRQNIAAKWRGNRDFPEKLYLTRRQYEKAQARANAARSPQQQQAAYQKMISNEEVAEALFAKRGFAVVVPEALSFEHQVMMISNATHIAGPAGSALHMILFNPNPEAKVIMLDTRSISNQKYIANQVWVETLRGVRGYHISCVKSRDENGVPAIDAAIVEQALSHIL